MPARHRLLRAAALAAALAAPAWWLAGEASLRPVTAARVVTLPVADEGPPAYGRALFAPAVDDVTPAEAPTLLGIAGRLPGAGVALLRLADGTTRAVPVGGNADGWRVEAIGADRVRLARGPLRRDEVLPLRDAAQ